MYNWVDLLIVLTLFIFTLEGFGKSLIGELLDLTSFILALLLSLRFYNSISNLLQGNFSLTHSIANVIGFFLIWSLVEIILAVLAKFIYQMIPGIGYLDKKLRVFSAIPSFFRGLILISILLVLIMDLPVQPMVKNAVNQSKLSKQIITKASQLEGPLKSVFGGLTQDTLTFLTVEPKTNASVDLGFRTTDYTINSDLEDQMLKLLNNERSIRGLHQLSFDQNLRSIARAHSEDMFIRGYFSHYSPEGKTVADRANEAGIDYSVIGENLAFAPTLELAHNGLMNSPGHRANILSTDYNKVGIGIADTPQYGLMITQDFSN